MKPDIARAADRVLRVNALDRGEQPIATLTRAVVNGDNQVVLDFSKIKSLDDFLAALGISLTSPNGKRWRLSINNDGSLEREEIA